MPKKADILIRDVDRELRQRFHLLCIKQKTNMTAKIKAMIQREVDSTLNQERSRHKSQ